jgi:hypothetical protein
VGLKSGFSSVDALALCEYGNGASCCRISATFAIALVEDVGVTGVYAEVERGGMLDLVPLGVPVPIPLQS